MKATTTEPANRAVFWHRDLPPLDAEPGGQVMVEATSGHVLDTLERRSALWDRCYDELMAHAQQRIAQETARLGGDCAHVYDESVDVKHDWAAGETWLHGQFHFTVYRRPAAG